MFQKSQPKMLENKQFKQKLRGDVVDNLDKVFVAHSNLSQLVCKNNNLKKKIKFYYFKDVLKSLHANATSITARLQMVKMGRDQLHLVKPMTI